MPSLLPVYHYFCQYARLVASLAFLLPVCPPFCQCTIIVVNMPLRVVNVYFLLPECPPCQCRFLVASMTSLLPVYHYCCQYAPPCCQHILFVASLPLLLPVCPQYALLAASVSSCLFTTYLTVHDIRSVAKLYVYQTCCYLLTAVTFGRKNHNNKCKCIKLQGVSFMVTLSTTAVQHVSADTAVQCDVAVVLGDTIKRLKGYRIS